MIHILHQPDAAGLRVEDADIDWKHIFAKYVARVCNHEGVDFLYEAEWTSDEWAAIQSAQADIDKACERLGLKS